MKNIVLIGMRGSGKSTIGKKIAKILNINFIDIDEKIEKEEDCSIFQIIDKNGWTYFRKKESEITEKIAKNEDHVIATGGGIVLNKKNIEILKSTGVLVLLNTDIKILKKRIEKSKNRPSLTGVSHTEELEKVWKDRKEKYYKAANIVIDTSKKEDIQTKAEKIIELTNNLR